MSKLRVSYLNHGVRNWHVQPTPFHYSDGIQIVTSTRGTFLFQTRSRTWEVQPGQVVVIPPRLMKRFAAKKGPVEMFVMICDGLGAMWVQALLPRNQPRVFTLSAQDLATVQDLYRRCRHEQGGTDMLANDALASMVQSWLAILLRSEQPRRTSPTDSRLAAMSARIAAEFDHPLKISELARMAGMSEPHFREAYHKLFGRSPKQDIMRRRLMGAQELLAGTDLKLQTIAERCGFADEHEFSKFFNRHTGIPPGKWRRRA